jgi:hypothetical protein
MAAQHFVLHLHAVARVEKLVCGKRRIAHPLGVYVQRARFPQGDTLGIFAMGTTRHMSI